MLLSNGNYIQHNIFAEIIYRSNGKQTSMSLNLLHQTPCLSAEGDPPKYGSQVDVFQQDRILF